MSEATLPQSGVVRARVAAWCAMRAAPAEIAPWRRSPSPAGMEPLPVTLLKHSDNQTVLALVAVLRAMARAGWPTSHCVDWGVLAGPRFFGRSQMAESLQKYIQGGAWEITPHLIPHHSLHAVSGTISQALKIHGPNFGAGGGPDVGADPFLVAASMLCGLPGLWLVMTGHVLEQLPPTGPDSVDPSCEAVALALLPVDDSDELHLSIGGGDANDFPAFHLAELVDTLLGDAPPAPCRWRLPGFGWIAFGPGREGGAR